MSIPVSAVIATKDRPEKLANLFRSIRAQDVSLAEVVVVDASADGRTKALCDGPEAPQSTRWMQATNVGAACQRNEGVATATQPHVLFADDDVVLEGGCLRALWEALQSDPGIGGVDAIITNQCYHPLGRISRTFYTWLNGAPLHSFAGRLVAGVAAFHPEDRLAVAGLEKTDWLATACVLYRHAALPDPPFDPFFTGYSYAEDLAMSLIVARKWRLANTSRARAYHDATPGSHRLGAREFARMSLVSKHYILTKVIGKNGVSDYLKWCAFEAFSLASLLRTSKGRRQWPAAVCGKALGILEVLGVRVRDRDVDRLRRHTRR